MATTAQGGYGLAMTINGAALVQVETADMPSFMKFIAEATGHDSPSGYYEAVATGKRRIEPLNVTLFWDKNAASHSAVLAAFNADTAVLFTSADPDADETIAFRAHVERIGRMTQQEEAYRAEVALHPTGTATIT